MAAEYSNHNDRSKLPLCLTSRLTSHPDFSDRAARSSHRVLRLLRPTYGRRSLPDDFIMQVRQS